MAKKKRKPVNHKNKNYQTHFEICENNFDFESRARYLFKHKSRAIRAQSNLAPDVLDGLDYDSARQKRRIQAMHALLDEVKSKVQDICPDIPDVFSISEDWADINTYPIPSYDYEERFSYSALACAIWILDQIKEAGKMTDLMLILKPANERAGFLIPSVWDPCHSIDVIKSMVERIHFRNESEDYGSFQGDLCRLYMTEPVLKSEIDHSLPNRSAFDEILALIPESSIQTAIEHYEIQYWNWIIRHYKGRRYFAKQEEALKEELDALLNRISDYSKQLSDMESEQKAARNNLLSPIGAMDPTALLHKLNDESSEIDRMVPKKAHWEAAYSSIEKRMDQLNFKINDYQQRSGFFIHKSYDSIKNEYGEEVADIWSNLDIGDPYELCFAFLYLLDSGSDLPWCYFAGANLLTAAASLLPWPRNRYNYCADGVWKHIDRETGEPVPGPDEEPLPKRIRVPEPDNWLQLQYSDPSDNNDLYNLGQAIYEATGCIMPRKLDRYRPALRTLDRYGIRGKQALRPLMYCMSLLGEGKNQTQPYYASIRFVPDEEKEEKNEETSMEEIRSQFAALREENKRLKQQAYDTGREVRDERERYEALAQKVANDAQELHDLRELIFNHQSDQYETAPASEIIQFPYRTDKRIVVFGGHDSWVKEMRPKFPDVRFIDRGMVPNPDLIRRADVVWIQPNALSHGYYYKIIDEVRKNNIRVRYFSYASPAKCAEQLVLDDCKKS